MRLTTCRYRVRLCMFACAFVAGLGSRICGAEAAPSQPLAVSVASGQCLFTLGTEGAAVLNAGVAAKVDHVWLHSADYPKCTVAETDVSARKRWLDSLQRIRDLSPAGVIPGHSKVGAPVDATSAVDFTEKYLLIFEEELKKARTPDDLVKAMKERFPSADLLLAIERGANANVKH